MPRVTGGREAKVPHVQKTDDRAALKAQQWLGKHLDTVV